MIEGSVKKISVTCFAKYNHLSPAQENG